MKTFKDFTKLNTKTLYVSRQVLNGLQIRQWFLANGFDKTIDPDHMHITIALSTNKVNWSSCYFSKQKLILPQDDSRYMKTLGEDHSCKVLCVNSDILNTEWKYFRNRGAS